MITYINDIVPHFALATGKPIYDGYLIGAGYGFTELAPINQCATPAVPGTPASPEEPGIEQFVVHPPRNAPVIDFQTLSDSYSFFGWAGEEPDSDTPTDRYMLYQIPGASHIWTYQVAYTPGAAELSRDGYPANDWQDQCLDTNLNPFPLQYFMDAGFANLDAWVNTVRRHPMRHTSPQSATARPRRRSSTTSTATRLAACATRTSTCRSAPTTARRPGRGHAGCSGDTGPPSASRSSSSCTRRTPTMFRT